MANITKKSNNLSTKTLTDPEFLLTQIEQSKEILSNVREKIDHIQQLKKEVNRMITGLNKIIEAEQIKAVKQSLKINK